MTHSPISLATVYSSAQCVLSVVGSVGVILLFAGIPQLIYSPVISAGNLLTFLMGAILITAMVAGNSFLNYRYRRLDQDPNGRQRSNEGESGGTRDPEDKPPSYEAVLTLDGQPPEYSTIIPEKPPRYEEIIRETTACNTADNASVTVAVAVAATATACEDEAQVTLEVTLHTPAGGATPPQVRQENNITLSRIEEEDVGVEKANEGKQSDEREADSVEEASSREPKQTHHSEAVSTSDASQHQDESET